MTLPHWTTFAAALLLFVTLGAVPGQAQYRTGSAFPISGGPRVGRDFGNHAWSLGAQIQVPVGRSLELRPSGDFFFHKHEKTGRQLNADAALRFGQGGFYAGGGFAWLDLAESGGKQRGHNLFFGLSDHQAKRMTSFVEFRWTFYNDTKPFRLAVGFNYALTGS